MTEEEPNIFDRIAKLDRERDRLIEDINRLENTCFFLFFLLCAVVALSIVVRGH